MTTKTPTIQGVRAKLKRSAAAAGLHLELSHSLKGWRQGVQVDTGYTQDAHRANLKHFTEHSAGHTGTIMDWLRSVLSYDELVTVPVRVVVNNSEMQVDYFAEDQIRVLPDWATFVELGSISNGWANDMLGIETNGWSYDRGTRAFTEDEVEALAPSEAHALALAVIVLNVPGTPATIAVDRFAGLDETGRSLFLSMLADWSGTVSELLDAVEVLVPQESPAPVEPAPAPEEDGPVDPELLALGLPSHLQAPKALEEYFARLVHAPKREHAKRVWNAIKWDLELPHVAAPWAADVVRKVRRYANS
jgi:hypothetical protein